MRSVAPLKRRSQKIPLPLCPDGRAAWKAKGPRQGILCPDPKGQGDPPGRQRVRGSTKKRYFPVSPLVLNEAIYLNEALPLDIIRSYRMQVLPSHHRTLCGDCHYPTITSE
jgi:hypothetical protein